MDEGSLLRRRFGDQKSVRKRPMSRATEFVLANKLLFYVFVLCVGTLAMLYRPETNGTWKKVLTNR
jgi:hypothetical protein